VNLPARDPVALCRWYVENLGFSMRGRFLWSAGTMLAFPKGEPVTSGQVHFGFRVETMDELRGWVARLRERGVDVPEPEGDEEYTTTRIDDPEGNEIELFFEPPP
jgi:catechol-2,3-dioxygenase